MSAELAQPPDSPFKCLANDMHVNGVLHLEKSLLYGRDFSAIYHRFPCYIPKLFFYVRKIKINVRKLFFYREKIFFLREKNKNLT